MDYKTVLINASNLLKKYNINNPILDSELLLSSSLQITRENLLLNLNNIIRPTENKLFQNLLRKRIKKMPIAYILGYKYFWRSKFFVNNSVLIPRPETEIIVEEALKFMSTKKPINILDIGTGSGCIIISLLKEIPKSKGVGLDISKNAIKVAKINAKIQQINNRIKFVNSDIDKFKSGKYDLIVSNPPYIKKIKINRLKEDVRNFEPQKALDGGYSGYSKIETVIKNSLELLKRNRKLILEIGHDQANQATLILEKYGFYINKISKDLFSRYRCIVATKY
mgnify:CR=1 FL=1